MAVIEVGHCLDLSHERTQTPDRQSGLCAVCDKIDFISLTRKACVFQGCEIYTDERHYHVGALQHITQKAFCPGCRLILSVARTSDRSLSLSSTVAIQRQFLSTWTSDPSDSFLERVETNSAHMEGSIEVTLDNSDGQYWEFPVLGTIMRTVEANSADSDSMRSTDLESDYPAIRGRSIQPQVDTNLIKHWIQSCNIHHEYCHLPTLELARDQKIRLIDVQEYRIILNTSVEKYVALSYVWGPDSKPLLTRNTLSKCSSPGGLRDMTIPRTISDAIQLMLHIGKRYLWVDSLCIQQDDENDKKQQLAIMDNIYTNAEFVVVAAAGGDANAGLPGTGSTPRRITQTVEKINGVEFITTQTSVQQALERTVWNTRGWTFQELILSQRVLIFTESLVYWCCQLGTWREDMSGESSRVGLRLNETDSLWPHQLRARFRTIFPCPTSLYCQLAQRFSQRVFKEERDIVWAFIGTLRLLKPRFRKGFIWALPYERLDAALLWSDTTCKNLHSRDARHSMFMKKSLYNLPYPSWSWLSTEQGISFWDQCGGSVVSEVDWHAPLKLGDNAAASFLDSTCSKGVANDHGKGLQISLLAGSASASDGMDYGLLHFTARTTVLTLRRIAESTAEEALIVEIVDNRVKATIHSFGGKQIGILAVPRPLFNKTSECSKEFVLLSSNAEEKSDECCQKVGEGDVRGCSSINHVRGCSHIQSLNIMLIEWEGDIAYRRALGRVEKKNWKDIETQSKTIILG